MKQLLLSLVMLLAGIGAWAQGEALVLPTFTYEELNNATETKLIAIRCTQITNYNTFYNGTGMRKNLLWTEDMIFEWEPTNDGDNTHYIKKAYHADGDENIYLLNTNITSFGSKDADNVAKFTALEVTNDIADSGLNSEEDQTYRVRLALNPNKTTWFNFNGNQYNGGTGVWTVQHVIDYIAAWKENAIAKSELGYIGGYDASLRSEIEKINTKDEMDKFIAEHASDIIPMTPGYYYIKGTGTGNNNANWYATYSDDKTKFTATNIDETDKIKFAWKFEAVEDGYKMLSCNLNKYAKLDNASANGGSASTLAEGLDDSHTFVITGKGSSATSTIKNGDGQVMRTEGSGAINYWDNVNGKNESWYIIPVPAEDLAMTVTIGATGYSSAYLPVDVTLPENLEAYIVTNTTETSATMTKVDDIKGHQGVILKGEAGSYTLPATTAASSDFSNNKLKGSVLETYVADEAYVLSNVNGTTGFYKAALNKDENGNVGTTHFKNNARKAYLPVANSAAARFVFDFGTETGIENIEGTETGSTGNAAIYDLSGRRVKSAQKGIYIVNGKKVIK